MNKKISFLVSFFFVIQFGTLAQGPQIKVETSSDVNVRYLYTDTISIQSPSPVDTIYFSNTGDEPLILSAVKGDPCICTGAPQVPVLPDEMFFLVVKCPYRPKGDSVRTTFTITSNASNTPILCFQVIAYWVE